MTIQLLAAACGIIAGIAAVLVDLRRRRLSLRRIAGWNALVALDVAAVAFISAIGITEFILLVPQIATRKAVPLDVAQTWYVAVAVVVGLLLWAEGRRQVQLQRPRGLVAGEALIAVGTCALVGSIAWPESANFGTATITGRFVFVLPLLVGGVLIASVVPRFVSGREEHRILERIAAQGEFVQSEWIPPTPECPEPERWAMLDPQTAEIEVLDLLRSLVRTVKPRLIVETGTFIGHSAIEMARALEQNGEGRIITIEFDPAVYAKAVENIEASGLGKWIEARNASSLETAIEGRIDLLYSDSDLGIREQEVRRFLPQIAPRGLVLIHDASSHFGVVREAAFRLEREGLLSVILLSSPRGLCIAQKREGRT